MVGGQVIPIPKASDTDETTVTTEYSKARNHMKAILTLATVLIVSLPALAADRCLPIKQSKLLLPSEQFFMRKYFIDKARQLNDSGRCVVDGGYDQLNKVFFYRVNDTSDPNQLTTLQYTFQQLSKRNMNR
jgi:hypothetical protein